LTPVLAMGDRFLNNLAPSRPYTAVRTLAAPALFAQIACCEPALITDRNARTGYIAAMGNGATLRRQCSRPSSTLHPFVERLVGTLRRECLDRTLFRTTADLEAKLREFQKYFNEHRTHAGLKGRLPNSGRPGAPISFASYRWQKHCRGLYQTPIAA